MDEIKTRNIQISDQLVFLCIFVSFYLYRHWLFVDSWFYSFETKINHNKENNYYNKSTPFERVTSGSISSRVKPNLALIFTIFLLEERI